VVGFDPVLARLSQSESYYGTTTSLLFFAAALLSLGAAPRAPPLRLRVPLFVAAGLLVSAAARIHPACWPAAAVVPLGLACQRGSRRRSLVLVLVSAAIVFAVVLVTSAASLHAVINGSLGERWHGAAAGSFTRRALGVAPVALLGGILVTRPPRLARALGVIVLGVLVARATNLVDRQTPWIDAAALWLFAPVLVPAAASALSATEGLRQRVRPAVAAVLAAFAIAAAYEFPRVSRLPTDVLEAEWVRTLRRDVPEGASFLYLERVAQRVDHLPLYTLGAAERRVLGISASDVALAARMRGEDVYYRSSLCSTTEGRDVCARIESMFDLHEMASKELPALGSMQHLDYDVPSVRVALFRATLRTLHGSRP
jgi:hypothetical protein